MTPPLKSVGPLQAVVYAQSMAMEEMVSRGEITEDQANHIARRADEIIVAFMRGDVLERGPNGVYEARTPTAEEAAKVAALKAEAEGKPPTLPGTLRIGG